MANINNNMNLYAYIADAEARGGITTLRVAEESIDLGYEPAKRN